MLRLLLHSPPRRWASESGKRQSWKLLWKKEDQYEKKEVSTSVYLNAQSFILSFEYAVFLEKKQLKLKFCQLISFVNCHWRRCQHHSLVLTFCRFWPRYAPVCCGHPFFCSFYLKKQNRGLRAPHAYPGHRPLRPHLHICNVNRKSAKNPSLG